MDNELELEADKTPRRKSKANKPKKSETNQKKSIASQSNNWNLGLGANRLHSDHDRHVN
jgi:hypothetical protein